MLTEGQKNYLNKLSYTRANAKVYLKEYDPAVRKIAENIITKIKNLIPNADVRFMGASALGIGGQNDIDIYVLYQKVLIERYVSLLNSMFGEQEKKKWHWYEDGIEVSVYVSDPEDPKQKEQIDLFNLLKSNRKLLDEYGKIKELANGKTYVEYQTAKYEFYNKVLGIKP